jgi:hypothetical protein
MARKKKLKRFRAVTAVKELAGTRRDASADAGRARSEEAEEGEAQGNAWQDFGGCLTRFLCVETSCPHAGFDPFYWNWTVTVRFMFMVTVHLFPDMESQPDVQVAEVEGAVGEGVSMTEVPVLKINPQVCEQAIPAGVLTTVPLPPAKVTIRLGPVGPVPVKHTTVAVMKPVCIPPLMAALVAETRVLPQALPVAVIVPVASTVTI